MVSKKNIAIIPLRGGSKSIPFKNIKVIAGQPLAYWTIQAAVGCNYIDEVMVATDSEEIVQALSFIQNPKIKFFKRSSLNAQDTSSTESVMQEVFEKNLCSNLILIQATSPLLTSRDLNEAFCKYFQEEYDSMLSLVRIKRFFWELKGAEVVALNYDYFNRPRRQDFEGQLVENGAFYITKYECFKKSNCRISGKIGFYEMCEDSYFEIDEPQDWIIVEELLKIKNKEKNTINKIKLFLSDVDGCLTDGGMYYSENGDESKKFNTKDGKGFELLRLAGVKTGIITAEDRLLNKRRAEKLKLDYHYHGVRNKLEVAIEIAKELNIDLSEVAYVGDDVNDLELIKAVGFSISPQDAVFEVRQASSYVAQKRGGEGVIREAVEKILKEIN